MKKILVIALATLFATGCAKKAQKESVFEQYKNMSEQLDSKFQSAQTEQEADSIFNDFLTTSLDLIQQNPKTADAYQITKDIIPYFTLQQKELAFAALDIDSLEQYELLKYYQAFISEKNTSVGQQYLDFKSITPEGDTLALSQVIEANEYVLIDFWASWCRPCRELLPELMQLYNDCKGHLQILGVSQDESREDWINLIQNMQLPWLQVSDLTGWNNPACQMYGVTAIPCTVLINHEGKIIAREEHDINILRQLILQDNTTVE